MNGVIGLADLLIATDLDERQRQYVAGVQTAGEALLAIINDVLDFSKIEAGRMELDLIDLEVTQVIEEVAGLLARQAHAKGIELIIRGCLELSTPLRGDPSRLRQVLLNLTANAIKFTDVGEVVLSAQLAAASEDAVDLTFEVSDTGIGISPADRERVFQPFFQVDASTTRRFGGTTADSAPAASSASPSASPVVVLALCRHPSLGRRCRTACRCWWSMTTPRTA
jgi:two-component system sensor histidine kinase/response regulator